ELPTDRPRPAVQSTNGAYVTFELPGALSDRVRELSRREGATLFMTLLAAFQTLLYRYSGQTDICVGTPIAGRNHAELEGLIGFFVNTLVMRTDLSGEPSFRDLLRQVREVALGAYAHQDVPFEMLVDELQPERNTGHTPLFQVMFVLQNAPHGEIELPGLTLSTLDLQTGVARFDLTLAMIDVPGALAGAVEYSSDLFDEATIRRMVGHFERLLAAAVADPDRPIRRLPLLTAAERHTLLVEWNDTKADVPSDRCAHELFEEQAARPPEAIAARCGEETLTYAELNRRANQLAHALRRRGVGPEMLVAIAATRSLEMVVGLLGVLKAGGAYLPIDPPYPRERIAFMLEDAGVRTLLPQAALLERLPAHRAETICLDTDWPEIARESTENPQSGVKPGNRAYGIYTSGSTGKPKGAMSEHRGLVNYLAWCQRAYPLRQGSGAPVHSSISFDLTITGLFAPLKVCSCVTLLPEGNEVEALSEALRTSQEAFSLVKITPAHLELVSQQLGPQEATDRTHAFIIGGEALHYEQLRFWQRYAPGTALINE
ncbi:MAG: AMP-binding protein, partial [Chloroflexi bacterium]|nr:AMP-binding protein [Chloroflexota bacterium]